VNVCNYSLIAVEKFFFFAKTILNFDQPGGFRLGLSDMILLK
jgi:hypothetical protein